MSLKDPQTYKASLLKQESYLARGAESVGQNKDVNSMLTFFYQSTPSATPPIGATTQNQGNSTIPNTTKPPAHVQNVVGSATVPIASPHATAHPPLPSAQSVGSPWISPPSKQSVPSSKNPNQINEPNQLYKSREVARNADLRQSQQRPVVQQHSESHTIHNIHSNPSQPKQTMAADSSSNANKPQDTQAFPTKKRTHSSTSQDEMAAPAHKPPQAFQPESLMLPISSSTRGNGASQVPNSRTPSEHIPMLVNQSRKPFIDEISEEMSFELHTLFSDLQTMATDFGIKVETPEVVVTGMQSDGKSSFIEGFLGFQFNLVDTGIGTRRPLIIQMINDPQRIVPSCKFKREDSAHLEAFEDSFEAFDTPVNQLASEIQRRTNEKAGTSKNNVSEVPIILRVVYQGCANMTIFDTPGFRLNGSETLKNDILNMVLRIAQHKHRIIVCLDQSTVEWANSCSRPIIAGVDPQFDRTILVNTKFDNRLKELTTPQSANTYLAGEGLPPGRKPFFISMPIRRDLDAASFKLAMKECYNNDYATLAALGFDESKYGSQIGIYNLKRHIEEQILTKYVENIAPIRRQLDSSIENVMSESRDLEVQLEKADIPRLRKQVIMFVQALSSLIIKVLKAGSGVLTSIHRQTLQQEKIQSGFLGWPLPPGSWKPARSFFSVDTAMDISGAPSNANGMNPDQQVAIGPSLEEALLADIPDANLDLCGGKQIHRLLSEFQYVVLSVELPPLSLADIASAEGINSSSHLMGPISAATEIARSRAEVLLHPMIEAFILRINYIFKNVFDDCMETMKSSDQHSPFITSSGEFMDEIRSILYEFIGMWAHKCKVVMKSDLGRITGGVNEHLSIGKRASVEDSRSRVLNHLKSTPEQYLQSNHRATEGSRQEFIFELAQNLFGNMTSIFASFSRDAIVSFMLTPLFDELASHILEHFAGVSDERMEIIFQLGTTELLDRKKILKAKLSHLQSCQLRFQAIAEKLRSFTTL